MHFRKAKTAYKGKTGERMKNATRCIEAILEERFGHMEAQALKFGRARVTRRDVQFSDIKLMSDLVERYRIRVRACISTYRLWSAAQDIQVNSLERLYSAAEGAALHRHVSDAVKLWYFAHRDYHAMRREYLYKCLGPKATIEWGEDEKKAV